jgi:hypothetical protein
MWVLKGSDDGSTWGSWDLVRRPASGILKNTVFRKLDLFSSSDWGVGGRHAFCWPHVVRRTLVLTVAGWIRMYSVISFVALYEGYLLFGVYSPKCQSQWPRGLRHELSSPAGTLGSWVRISLEAWISRLCAFVLCVGIGLATG